MSEIMEEGFLEDGRKFIKERFEDGSSIKTIWPIPKVEYPWTCQYCGCHTPSKLRLDDGSPIQLNFHHPSKLFQTRFGNTSIIF